MIVLLAAVAMADPVSQRSPVDGDVAVAVGAPHQSVAVRWDRDDGSRLTVSASVRVPSAATDLSVGTSVHRGPERGWGWASGASVGLIAVRGPGIAASMSPWIRLERRGTVHGGVQLAAPLAVDPTGGFRVPVLGETFIGGRRGAVHVLAVGGAGWAWMSNTPAGSLVVQGSVQVGVER